MITWIVTFMALYGTWLNVKLKRTGFLLWMITNMYFSIHNFYQHEYAQSFLFLTYFTLAVWGFFSWK